MQPISYAAADLPVRAEITAAHNRFWQRLALPGCWFTGSERVAIAAEVRKARDCALCRQRKAALSPMHVDGAHDNTGQLRDVVVEAVHRITTDSGRLTRSWFDSLLKQGLTEGEYVEIIGTVGATLEIDTFCLGIGVGDHPLPAPESGEPSRYRPPLTENQTAWVAMLPAGKAGGAEADLWEGERVLNVERALSLVPDEVRTMNDISAAHYVPIDQFMDFTGSPHGTLSRVQIELVAARVSALNGCFY